MHDPGQINAGILRNVRRGTRGNPGTKSRTIWNVKEMGLKWTEQEHAETSLHYFLTSCIHLLWSV